ncbi:MAG: hypothetical protein ACI8W3_002728 [Myxococcota bacterium]|jgi:hypothetical protein
MLAGAIDATVPTFGPGKGPIHGQRSRIDDRLDCRVAWQSRRIDLDINRPQSKCEARLVAAAHTMDKTASDRSSANGIECTATAQQRATDARPSSYTSGSNA